MVYTLRCPDGFQWRITDGDSANRWVLWVRVGGSPWQRIASYSNPGAAALAVGGGDTGVTEWDDAPRDSAAFELSHWTRQDAA